MNFTVVAAGYYLIEAPRAFGEHVWFSDFMKGGLHRLSSNGQVDVFLPERKHIGGLVQNEDGRLICSGADGLVWLDPRTGASGALLDHIGGEPLAGVNDIQPDGQGGLYFGRLAAAAGDGRPSRPGQLWRLDPAGTTTLLDEGTGFCNGIGFSPDGTKVYYNESTVGTFVYDLRADGSLANKTRLHPRKDVDGLAVDVEGGVWVAHYASGEIARYLPDGAQDTTCALPHKAVISLCFGGPERRDLYVTTAGNTGVEALMAGVLPPLEACVFHSRSEVAGVALPQTRFRLGEPAHNQPFG